MTDSRPTVNELIAIGRDREAAREGMGRTPAAHAAPQNGATMDPLAQLDLLGPTLAGVVGTITTDQLDRPTPCGDYSVGDVLTHMVTGATAFAAAFRGEPSTPVTVTDPIAEFGPALDGLVAAITVPGALDRTVAAPFGDVPGETFARFVVLDGLVHSWDLATATDQPCTPPDELVAAVDEFAHSAIDPLRDGDTFADATTTAADATPIERLAAYTGRTVPTPDPAREVGS